MQVGFGVECLWNIFLVSNPKLVLNPATKVRSRGPLQREGARGGHIGFEPATKVRSREPLQPRNPDTMAGLKEESAHRERVKSTADERERVLAAMGARATPRNNQHAPVSESGAKTTAYGLLVSRPTMWAANWLSR